MTYLVLARKWRPRSFDTLVGQDHVVRALTHALSTQRLHHAWLFTGTRGVGKTTLSRLLAKSLNCETGITASPCGTCQACTEIDAGRFVDYVELDAASNRGVDEMTQLLEQAVYAPSAGRFKVYMIDEVHMLSGHAFNAMLKTLEEPPPHVKFILATTDPQKIPVTVLSRCLQFNLKQMTAESIVGHLQYILTQEAIPFELPALRLLAKAASGSMRDALSLTDQAIAYSAGNLTGEAVQGMLGTIDHGHLVSLLQALAQGQADQVVAIADQLAVRGLSFSGALGDLAILLSQVAIEQRVPGATATDDPLADDIVRLAGGLAPDVIQLFYTVAVHSRHELALAPDAYAGFVMACLRMLALVPTTHGQEPPPSSTPARAVTQGHGSEGIAVSAGANTVPAVAAAPQGLTRASALLSRPSPPEGNTAGPSVTQPSTLDDSPPWDDSPSGATQAKPQPNAAAQSPSHDVPSPTSASVPAPASTLEPTPVPEPAPTPASTEPEPERPLTSVPQADAALVEPDAFLDEPPLSDEEYAFDGYLPDDEALSEHVPLEVLQASPPVAQKGASARTRQPRLDRMTPKEWPALAAALPLTGLAAELARQSEWLGVEGNAVKLRVGIRTLAESSAQSRLRTVLSEHFASVVQVHIEWGATGDDTAHAVAQAQRAVLQEQAEKAVANDPLIATLVQQFDARVLPGSIRASQKAALSA